MIHLVAGESALGTLKQTSVPGDKFSIDDILMEGPAIDGLRTESSWKTRADYLERYHSMSASEYLSGKAERGRILVESLAHDEIVLWFEFDLFCQANLLYYLDWYASREVAPTRLSLICPESFPARPGFRGLGELHAPELESLFPQRADVTPEQKAVAKRAWEAFTNPDPRVIEQFIESDSSALPLVAPALRSHLDRFPSVANGLGIVSQKILETVSTQPMPFRTLFPTLVGTPQVFRHGMGDQQLQAYLDMWTLGPVPLLRETDVVEITGVGRDVLANRADAIDLNGVDLWYGGVHLRPDNQWRRDSANKLTHR
jgi:hypothetical protein